MHFQKTTWASMWSRSQNFVNVISSPLFRWRKYKTWSRQQLWWHKPSSSLCTNTETKLPSTWSVKRHRVGGVTSVPQVTPRETRATLPPSTHLRVTCSSSMPCPVVATLLRRLNASNRRLPQYIDACLTSSIPTPRGERLRVAAPRRLATLYKASTFSLSRVAVSGRER